MGGGKLSSHLISVPADNDQGIVESTIITPNISERCWVQILLLKHPTLEEWIEDAVYLVIEEGLRVLDVFDF